MKHKVKKIILSRQDITQVLCSRHYPIYGLTTYVCGDDMRELEFVAEDSRIAPTPKFLSHNIWREANALRLPWPCCTK